MRILELVCCEMLNFVYKAGTEEHWYIWILGVDSKFQWQMCTDRPTVGRMITLRLLPVGSKCSPQRPHSQASHPVS
jgi:hypothetical protein